MWAIQGGTKLTLNSPTVAGNHCTTSDHNFERGNYAVPSHETRNINDDGGVPTLPISSTYAAVTDANQMDTTPIATPGAVITTEARDSKVASSVPEQHSTQIVMQDIPEFKGVGPITQHMTCIKPTAAVAIDPAADQKGAELSADPGPDPDRATAVAASAADEVSSTEDMPTVCDGNPSPTKGIGHNEGIQGDVTPMPTPKKP